MAFVHPLLLAGLLLTGVPVLLHLVTRQKPKHILFPAVRFLLARHQTNQRRLRLRNLFLLLLRMLLVALICLALARPKLSDAENAALSSEQPVAAVFLFDTSYSMGLAAVREAGPGKTALRTRLDEARARAMELLEQLPEESRVAVLDSSGGGGEGFVSLAEAASRMRELDLRPANAPVTNQLRYALELLERARLETQNPDDAARPVLCVFGDRTPASWDIGQAENLCRLRERVPGLHMTYFDVGEDHPSDLAVVDLDLPHQVVSVGRPVVIRATVRATGQGGENEVVCRFDGDPKTEEHKPVRLENGQSQLVTFERRGLPEGWHQIEVSFQAGDHALPFNNVRYATVVVHGPRRVLTVTDAQAYGPFREGNAALWNLALSTRSEVGPFACQVRTTKQAEELYPQSLRADYEAVVLLDVASPSRELWEKLREYVRLGGGLAVIPGGQELNVDAYRSEPAREILPGQLVRVLAPPPPGAPWDWSNNDYQHPLLAPFREWRLEGVDFFRHPRHAERYWEVKPQGAGASTIVRYDDAAKHPALLERIMPTKGSAPGRVLLFTTTFDGRPWNDYAQTITFFFPTIAQLTASYLTGQAQDSSANYLSGQAPAVRVPRTATFPTYSVVGPGLTGPDAVLPHTAGEGDLVIAKAVMPGNYRVTAPDGTITGCFSVNIPPEESDLSRLPPEAMEAVLGPGGLIAVEPRMNMAEAMQRRRGVSIPPSLWLAGLLLLFFVAETLTANRFYRPSADAAATPEGAIG